MNDYRFNVPAAECDALVHYIHENKIQGHWLPYSLGLVFVLHLDEQTADYICLRFNVTRCTKTVSLV